MSYLMTSDNYKFIFNFFLVDGLQKKKSLSTLICRTKF